MFHRVPFISPASVVTAAVILVLAALLASSLSSPGTAHADHPDLPEVSITSITPEIGGEGGRLRVTLQLSRPLTADEKYCYRGSVSDGNNGEVCIEGGILVWDNYDDHLKDENTGDVDNLTAFVFRGGETEQRKTVEIADDQCITPDREIRIAINWAFDNSDDYGYTIASDSGEESQRTVRVHGNDETNGGVFGVDQGGKCKAINDGEDEDVIENRAPTFGKNPLTLSVPENTEAGEEIGSPVTATDEENDDLTYSLTGADADHFDIDSSTGQIETLGDLDHETKSTYHLAVSVTDGYDIYGDPDSAEDDSIGVTITVDNVNEAPVFADDAPTALNVIENTAAGVDIGDPVTATDPEGKTVTYELDDGDGAAFEIDDTTGQIKTKASLMDEAQDTYTVTVTASDDGSNEAEHVVTITVTDANDPPEFTDDNGDVQTSVTREVAENTAVDQPVGDPVAATDEESDTLTYSLGGTDGANFDIDTTTGQIRTEDPLDFEGGPTSYSVTVEVTDGKDINDNADTVEDATIDVTINVTDVNEPPAFADDAPATQDVAENTATDQNIGSPYTATDPDTTNDTLTYSLGGTDAASFAVDDTSGQLKTKDPLDHETKDSYSVTIQVTDGKDAEGNTETPATIDDTHDVTITVTDADDQGSITLSTQTPTVGSTLTATVVDQDGGVTDETWVWESSTDQNTWTPIAGETTSSYTPVAGDENEYLRVSVTYNDDDGAGKTAQEETSSAVVLRPATNEHPSFADDTTDRSVAENTSAGQNIGDPVTATHADSVGTLVYSLGATGASNFDINSSTGQLKTKTVFDYETDGTSYPVTVSVSDGMDSYSNADTAVDSRIDVTINVTDINEKPQFAAETISFTIPEDTSVGQSVGNALSATDPDPSDTVTYSASGTDAALFQVDSNGQLQVKEALDYEDGDTLTVVVSATDSRDDSGTTEQTPLPDDTITVTVTVTNVFEAPRFNDDDGSGTVTRSIPENTAADQPVGLPVSATDDEGDTLTYELSGTDVDSFNFDTGTGQIKTKDDLDHETQEFYSVTVSVSDGKANDGTTADTTMDTHIAVTIEVEDVNEAPAFADDAVTDLEVAENTDVDQPIGSPFTATDPDDGETLTYGLSGTDAASFDIDTETGQIKTLAALDHETKETYSVTVTVSDGRDNAGNDETTPTADTTMDVTIIVTDEDDLGTITLSSNQPSAGVELTATLEDDDGVKTDVDVTWVWESSSDPSDPSLWTVIAGASTNIYIPQEDVTGDYLRVTAIYDDELGQGKTAQEETDSAVLTMTATNELPAFDANLTTTLSVQENTPAGENIGDPFTATDNDDTALTYVLGGTDGASFDIDTSTGQLKTKEVLDFENVPNKTSYIVTVSVHDGKDPFGNTNAVADATVEVTINVTDMVVPAVPERPTVNPTQGAAAGLTVTWTAVADTATAPVDGYDVQYRVKDTTNPPAWSRANVTVTGTSATITALVYSTTYDVQVQARNSEGPSGWSPTGEGTIPAQAGRDPLPRKPNRQ